MTVDPNSLDLPAFMAEHLQRAEPDLLRNMLSTFVAALMSAEADAICGAPYGEPLQARSQRRGGQPGRASSRRGSHPGQGVPPVLPARGSPQAVRLPGLVV